MTTIINNTFNLNVTNNFGANPLAGGMTLQLASGIMAS